MNKWFEVHVIELADSPHECCMSSSACGLVGSSLARRQSSSCSLLSSCASSASSSVGARAEIRLRAASCGSACSCSSIDRLSAIACLQLVGFRRLRVVPMRPHRDALGMVRHGRRGRRSGERGAFVREMRAAPRIKWQHLHVYKKCHRCLMLLTSEP